LLVDPPNSDKKENTPNLEGVLGGVPGRSLIIFFHTARPVAKILETYQILKSFPSSTDANSPPTLPELDILRSLTDVQIYETSPKLTSFAALATIYIGSSLVFSSVTYTWWKIDQRADL